MKILKKTLFAMILAMGFVISVSAQKQDDKKKEAPKDKPPVIKIEPKNDEKPKNEDKKDDKKKPELAFLVISNRNEAV